MRLPLSATLLLVEALVIVPPALDPRVIHERDGPVSAPLRKLRKRVGLQGKHRVFGLLVAHRREPGLRMAAREERDDRGIGPRRDREDVREADAFASGLLMPRRLIRPVVNKGELTFDRVLDIAAQFKTSAVSTAIRSVGLSDFPCSIAGIREGGIAWMFVSESLVESGCYPGERAAISSEMARTQCKEFRLGVSGRTRSEGRVRDWFRTYDRHYLEGLYLTEDYFPVEVMNTLLVLLTLEEKDLFGSEE